MVWVFLYIFISFNAYIIYWWTYFKWEVKDIFWEFDDCRYYSIFGSYYLRRSNNSPRISDVDK